MTAQQRDLQYKGRHKKTVLFIDSISISLSISNSNIISRISISISNIALRRRLPWKVPGCIYIRSFITDLPIYRWQGPCHKATRSYWALTLPPGLSETCSHFFFFLGKYTNMTKSWEEVSLIIFLISYRTFPMTIQGPSDARTQNANNNIENTHNTLSVNTLSVKKASSYKITVLKNRVWKNTVWKKQFGKIQFRQYSFEKYSFKNKF